MIDNDRFIPEVKESENMEEKIFISHQALEQVFTDSVEAGGIEVGGLLVGYPLNGRIHITRVIPTSRGSLIRVVITAQDMARAAEKLSPGEQLVGWYHSHPGHTVFFSNHDIDSHEKCLEFNPRFKGLVIDPHQAKRGDRIANCVKFYTTRNHIAIAIRDYRIIGSSGKRLYDPREFVFDRNGFPHRIPLLRAETTLIAKKRSDIGTLFEYDIFVCHASEDKEPFVRELAEKLLSEGLRIRYDEFTLSSGDSLRRKIDYGLTKSRHGVVVLSKHFFEKGWPQKELDSLAAREGGLRKAILPIWYGVTKEQVQSFSPILADRSAISSDKGISHVVNEIRKVLREDLSE